jgi:hypothetical protein
MSSSTQKLTSNLAHSLADCHIYGPAGAGNPTPDPADPIAYTMVPYEAPATDADGNRTSSHPESPPPDFLAATAGAESGAALLDQQEVIHDVSGDVFDDQVEVSHEESKGRQCMLILLLVTFSSTTRPHTLLPMLLIPPEWLR